MKQRRIIRNDAEAWKDFMPQPGNGGVPQHREVEAFKSAVQDNDELRQKVIGELRERSEGQPAIQLGILVASLSAFAIIVTMFPRTLDLTSASSLELFQSLFLTTGACVLALFMLGAALTAHQQSRTRHASSYLQAYLEVLPRLGDVPKS